MGYFKNLDIERQEQLLADTYYGADEPEMSPEELMLPRPRKGSGGVFFMLGRSVTKKCTTLEKSQKILDIYPKVYVEFF